MSQFLVDIVGEYKPGDQPPEGYLDWHEWAKVQHKSGLRQVKCCECGKWRFPQELSKRTGSQGKPLCLKCDWETSL